MTRYIEPTQAAGRALMLRGLSGQVMMLNLLRFRDVADYRAAPEIAPATAISGAAAYDLYVAHTLPYLHAAGGSVLFDGAAGPWLIGPMQEIWHRAMLIQQPSVMAFVAYRDDHAYLAGLGHRSAALADSRLLPLESVSV